MAGLDVPPSSFDVVWFSRFMYSQIPTRKTRVRMLSRIASALKPGGSLVCCFWWNPDRKTTGRVEAVRKAVALLTFANPGYQPGDELHGQDFVHGFADRGELLAEFRDGGFETVYLQVSSDAFAGGAVLQASKGDGGAAQRAK
jgi:SAM-dependent methyltransferase